MHGPYIRSVKYCGYRQASVLVFVLILISSMTIIALGLVYRARIEIKLSHSSSLKAKTYFLALAGLEKCKALLTQQQLTPERTAKICRFYSADNNRKLFEQLKVHPDEQMQLACWIEDEVGFLDLNKSDSASWENSGNISRSQRACILDWMDPDNDTSPDGAETDFYEHIEPPYTCKNAPFICLKELLFVKNINRDNYLGSILNYCIKSRLMNPDSVGSFLNKDVTGESALINIFTAHGQDKININTATGKILSILPGLDQQVTDAVLAYRAGPDGQERTEDDVIIEDIEAVSQAGEITELQSELLQQYCCYNSDIFRIFSYAKIKDCSCFLMATIKATENKPQVFLVERLF